MRRLCFSWCAVVVAVTAARFPLGAEKAWTTDGDAQFGKVRDETQAWREEDITECYSHSDRFAEETIFCDRECIRDSAEGEAGQCGGPWYCSKTVICQNDKRLRVREEDPVRDCITVRGCANHTDCFPSPGRAAAMHIVRPPGGFGEDVEKDGLKARFGGVTMRTYCCANDGDYDYAVDQPCNAVAPVSTLGGALWYTFVCLAVPVVAFYVLLVLVN